MKGIIAKAEDFIAWAKDVNNGTPIAKKCDLQDVYGRSRRCDIDSAFIAAEGERRLILCAVNNVMAFEEVEHLLSVLARHKTNSLLKEECAELDEKTAALAKERATFEDEKKSLLGQIATLQASLNESLQVVKTLNTKNNELGTKVCEYKVKAENFDFLKKIITGG
jgi:uncharacterized protein YhaN